MSRPAALEAIRERAPHKILVPRAVDPDNSNAQNLNAGIENRVFGLRLSEYHTGYRAFSAEVLESVNFMMNSDSFVFDQEINSRPALHAGMLDDCVI